MNGYANTFYGWGGEDDDLDHRIQQQNFTIRRSPANISRFYMQLHGPVSWNKKMLGSTSGHILGLLLIAWLATRCIDKLLETFC